MTKKLTKKEFKIYFIETYKMKFILEEEKLSIERAKINIRAKASELAETMNTKLSPKDIQELVSYIIEP